MDVIVDIDGTLADITHRLHLIAKPKPRWPEFFDACDGDAPIKTVLKMVHSIRRGEPSPGMENRLIFCTGRPEHTRGKTRYWLHKQSLNGPLYMRADGDFREDSIIKRELLVRIREDGYDPVLAIDDRKRVVDMWRAEGLVCAQVAEGEF